MILTSVDIFHQHYIDIENIKILLKVCRSLGISAKIHSSITCSGLSETDELLRKLGQDKLGVTVSQSAVLPIGKAKDLCESEIIKTVNIKSMYCPFHNMCEINWKGDVFACCSQSQNSAFCLGNIYKENITYILKNIRKNKYFFMLNKYGFEWIVDKVKKENIISINDMYSDSCDLCNELFSDRRVCNFLASMTV